MHSGKKRNKQRKKKEEEEPQVRAIIQFEKSIKAAALRSFDISTIVTEF